MAVVVRFGRLLVAQMTLQDAKFELNCMVAISGGDLAVVEKLFKGFLDKQPTFRMAAAGRWWGLTKKFNESLFVGVDS